MFFTIHYITALRMPQGRIQAIHLLSIHNNKQSPILAPTKIHIFPKSSKKTQFPYINSIISIKSITSIISILFFTFFNNLRLKFIYIKKSLYLCISFENNKTTRNQ